MLIIRTKSNKALTTTSTYNKELVNTLIES